MTRKRSLRMANHGEVCAHAAALVEEVRVDPFADGRIAADFCDTGVFHQGLGVGAHDIVHGEMRQVDHADVFRHRQVLGVGYAPEMTLIPLVLAYRHALAVFLQQVFVAGVTVRALPA